MCDLYSVCVATSPGEKPKKKKKKENEHQPTKEEKKTCASEVLVVAAKGEVVLRVRAARAPMACLRDRHAPDVGRCGLDDRAAATARC